VSNRDHWIRVSRDSVENQLQYNARQSPPGTTRNFTWGSTAKWHHRYKCVSPMYHSYLATAVTGNGEPERRHEMLWLSRREWPVVATQKLAGRISGGCFAFVKTVCSDVSPLGRPDPSPRVWRDRYSWNGDGWIHHPRRPTGFPLGHKIRMFHTCGDMPKDHVFVWAYHGPFL
jgi:hypothetical protein